MVMRAGYWVDLTTVQLDESNNTSWIQALPLGDYEHPVHGTISVTTERAARFADNVNNKVRSQDLDIDYDHKEKSGEAAGWVKQAKTDQSGLWILVEWTADALQKIKSKAYRYFSPEFVDEWTHPKTNQKFQDVLFGGGLTNRPFLKDILPINMSEVFDVVPHEAPKSKGGGKVTPEQIASAAAKLGLEEGASEEDVYNALQALPEPPKADSPQPEDAATIAARAIEEAKKLSENNPVVKSLMELITSQGKQLEENTTALRLAEVNNTVTQLAEHARKQGCALAPAALDELRTELVKAPKQLSEVIVKSTKAIIDAKVVSLTEKGKVRTTETANDDDPTKQLNDKVMKLTEGGKMSYADAVSKVASDDPDLYEAHRAASYAGGN